MNESSVRPIHKVGVVGAGVMGAGIAAHLANAGLRVVLLDIVPPNLTDAEKKDVRARNRFALLRARPAWPLSPGFRIGRDRRQWTHCTYR